MIDPKRSRILLVLAFAMLLSHTAQAFNTLSVNVTVNAANTFGACWDSNCTKPDLFVSISGHDGVSQKPRCTSNTVPDIIFVGPPAPADWSCGVAAMRPGRLYLALYDGDGPNNDNTAGEQVDIAPGNALAVTIDAETLARTTPGVPTTFVSSGDHGIITFTVTALINPGKLNGFSVNDYGFDPSVGERVEFTAAATGAPFTLVRLRAFDKAGTEVWNVSRPLDVQGQTSTKFTWTGRDAGGKPLPPGTYLVTHQAFDSVTGAPAIGILSNGTIAPGGMETISMTIDPPALKPSLNVLGTNPRPQWAPEVGDLEIFVVSNSDVEVFGEVYGNTSCTGSKLIHLPSVTVSALTDGTLMWRGPVFTGGAFPLGKYGIKVVGRTTYGAPTTPATICHTIEMIKAPRAFVYTQHAPFLAQPGDTVMLTARSVDEKGLPRVAGRIDVFGSVQSINGAPPSPPTTPLRSCVSATSCTATITMPSGHSFLTWRSMASDRENVPVADSGWRGQRVMDAASFAGVMDFAIPADIAMLGPLMADMRHQAFSHDIMLSVSTDFTWTDPIDWASIGIGFDQFMSNMWGIDGNPNAEPTTFLKRPDLVRVYAVPERNAVTWNPAANICDWRAPSIPMADVTGVLHNTNCRDNADLSTRSFSAKIQTPDVVMHEMHHALFGLADEYCCDGGYFESNPFPNVYKNVVDCLAVVGRDPSGCTAITQINVFTGMPTGRTFFRLDAGLPDIMVNSRIQRFGDIRQATWKESQCDAGKC